MIIVKGACLQDSDMGATNSHRTCVEVVLSKGLDGCFRHAQVLSVFGKLNFRGVSPFYLDCVNIAFVGLAVKTWFVRHSWNE